METNTSFGIIIYNEAWLLKGWLDNIKMYTDDIILFDQKSTDNIEDVVEEFSSKNPHITVTIKKKDNLGYCDPQRTELLNSGKYDWIMMMDADERLPENIPFNELIGYKYDAIWFPMRSLYFPEGKEYGSYSYKQCLEIGKEVNEGYPDLHPRLLKRGVEWPSKIHRMPNFPKSYNALEYDMLHLKTFEGQMAKNRKYAKLYPDMRDFQDNHCKYIQQQLHKPIIGLGI